MGPFPGAGQQLSRRRGTAFPGAGKTYTSFFAGGTNVTQLLKLNLVSDQVN